MAKLFEIDDSTFQQTVLDSTQPVLVDFSAPWCGPCKLVDPILADLSAEYGDRLRFVVINTDENYDTVAQCGVLNMPTLVLFQGGRELHRMIGYAPKAQIKRQIDRALTTG